MIQKLPSLKKLHVHVGWPMRTEQLRKFNRLDRGKIDIGQREYAWVPKGPEAPFALGGRTLETRSLPDAGDYIVVFLEGWSGCFEWGFGVESTEIEGLVCLSCPSL